MITQTGYGVKETTIFPVARAGKRGAIEIFENKHIPVFSVVTRWVSLEHSRE